MAAAKYLSVPLLIGLPMGVSWPRMTFVVRGVFLAELVATLFRLGWLYLISPIRLCNNYMLNDQQRLGEYMLAIGGGVLVWLGWKLLWGHFELFSGTGLPSAPVPKLYTGRPSCGTHSGRRSRDLELGGRARQRDDHQGAHQGCRL